jgi:HNH endonuclease
VFQVVKVAGHRYRLDGWLPQQLADAEPINLRLRYQVLQSGACRRCGRTVVDDGIKLQADHILPQKWGGDNLPINLQPLCEDCNAGKKDYYSAFDQFAPKIRQATSFSEPHRRIAAMLQAFEGGWVPSELLGVVASMQQYQEDWQKRTRELRYLGWEIETTRRGPRGSRRDVFYRATSTPELPAGNIAEIVRRIEKERAAAKKAGGSGAGPV